MRGLALAMTLVSGAEELAHAQEPQAQESPHEAATEAAVAPRRSVQDPGIRFSGKLELDHGFMKMFGLPLDMNGARAGLGLQTKKLSLYVLADLGVGGLPHRLGAAGGSLGAEALYRALPFLRVGGGVRASYLRIDRATVDNPMTALAVGAFLAANVDVYDFGVRDDHGAFLGARLDLDSYEGVASSGPLVWGPEFMVGFRY